MHIRLKDDAEPTSIFSNSCSQRIALASIYIYIFIIK